MMKRRPTHGKSYFRQVYKVIPGIPVVGNAQTDFTFDDQPDLRYARITNVCFFNAADLTTSRPNQIALLPAAAMNQISFSFRTNDPDDPLVEDKASPTKNLIRPGGDLGRFSRTLESVQYIPATLLHVNQNNTNSVWEMLEWYNTYIIWQETKIQIQSGGLLNTVDYAIVLGVWYTFFGVDGDVIYPRN